MVSTIDTHRVLRTHEGREALFKALKITAINQVAAGEAPDDCGIDFTFKALVVRFGVNE